MDSIKQQNELREIARKIRNARTEAHLSQAALGEYIGVSDKTISAYEKGRTIPPFEKLKKIAEYTRQPLMYFTHEQSDTVTIINKLTMIERELESIRTLLHKAQK